MRRRKRGRIAGFDTIAKSLEQHSSFGAGRGRPFQCSFCTIINVQGRESSRTTIGRNHNREMISTG
jgi:hypothetical protein